jgi:hypothetical protein
MDQTTTYSIPTRRASHLVSNWRDYITETRTQLTDWEQTYGLTPARRRVRITSEPVLLGF